MRRDSKTYFTEKKEQKQAYVNDKQKRAMEKAMARKRYTQRKVDQFIKWSINTRGYIKLKDIERIYKKYSN